MRNVHTKYTSLQIPQIPQIYIYIYIYIYIIYGGYCYSHVLYTVRTNFFYSESESTKITRCLYNDCYIDTITLHTRSLIG